MIDEKTREYVHSVVGAVPPRTGRIEEVLARGARRRRILRTGTFTLPFLAVVLVAASIRWLGPASLPFADRSEVTHVELPGGHAVEVGRQHQEIMGGLVYAGLPGPAPRFDTAPLGTEIPLTRRPISDVVFHAGAGELYVYLGDLGTDQIALSVVPERYRMHDADFCISLGTAEERACFGAAPQGHFAGYWAGPPGETGRDVVGIFVWTMLPQKTSVVQARLPDGSSYWQRPTSRTVVFPLPDDEGASEAQMFAFDEHENIIEVTNVPLDLRPLPEE